MASSHRAKVIRKLEVLDVDVISCHAVTKDEAFLALCPNNEEILIFQLENGEYQKFAVLSKHTQRVTGLSWSCEGHLASVSEDRTAIVWTWDGTAWGTGLVELRAEKAALCVSWSPDGQRFAVGLASKETAVCHYDTEVQSWVSQKLTKSKASVTALAWHPTSMYLATGSTDRRCLVYDVNPEAEVFGQVQVVEEAGCWVNAVSFSPSGKFLAFVGQDSSIRIKDLAGGPTQPATIVRWRKLPFLACEFVSEKQLLACGFDCTPVMISLVGGSWKALELDTSAPERAIPETAATGDDGSTSSFDQARANFRRGSSFTPGAPGALPGRPVVARRAEAPATLHTNTINSISVLTATRFSTSGLDGQVVLWEIS